MTGSTGIPQLSSIDLEFRCLLSAVLDECGADRDQIAADMTRRLGLEVENPINRSKLNDFTARTKTGARFPAIYIPALCEATADDRLRRFLQSRRTRLLIDLGSSVLKAITANKEAAQLLLGIDFDRARRLTARQGNLR
jgi:hypothetical protein